jgi:hypothetical protein
MKQSQVATRPANVTARMVREVLNVWRSAGATQDMACVWRLYARGENPGKQTSESFGSVLFHGRAGVKRWRMKSQPSSTWSTIATAVIIPLSFLPL